MKNILFSFFLVAFATVANAGTTVVNPGSDSGGFHAVLSMINSEIKGDFIQAGNPVIAGQHLDKENVLTIWSTEWPGNPETPRVDFSEETIVGLQVYETVLCSREFITMNDMKGKHIKIATWGDSPAVEKFIDNIHEKLGGFHFSGKKIWCAWTKYCVCRFRWKHWLETCSFCTIKKRGVQYGSAPGP